METRALSQPSRFPSLRGTQLDPSFCLSEYQKCSYEKSLWPLPVASRFTTGPRHGILPGEPIVTAKSQFLGNLFLVWPCLVEKEEGRKGSQIVNRCEIKSVAVSISAEISVHKSIFQNSVQELLSSGFRWPEQ
jgi:hypothetical protein